MSIRREALPELLTMWAELERLLELEGIGIAVADFGGLRTEADTNAINKFKLDDYNAYAAAERRAGRVPLPISGRWDNGAARPIAPFGRSFHNYGAARDFAIVGRPANLTHAGAVARVQQVAESIGLRSGRSFGDDPHLELPISLQEAAARWAEHQKGSSSSGSASMAAILLIVAVGVGALTVIRYSRGLSEWR